jgi:hypothetical protein
MHGPRRHVVVSGCAGSPNGQFSFGPTPLSFPKPNHAASRRVVVKGYRLEAVDVGIGQLHEDPRMFFAVNF